MDTLTDLDLVRAAPIGVHITRTDTETLPTMQVRFAPFDTWYPVSSWWEGDFVESIARGAFTKTIRESGDRLKIMFNHGQDLMIGEKLLGVPTNLREEHDSPVVDVTLFDSSYVRDLLPGIEAGVYGASFMFRVVKQEITEDPGRSDHNPDGLPERVVREVRLLEAGPVTWPANPAATTGLRSMTDAYYENLRTRDAHHVDRLEQRVRALRTPPPPQPDTTVDLAGAAPHDPIEPLVLQHSGASLGPRARRERLHPSLRSTTPHDPHRPDRGGDADGTVRAPR